MIVRMKLTGEGIGVLKQAMVATQEKYFKQIPNIIVGRDGVDRIHGLEIFGEGETQYLSHGQRLTIETGPLTSAFDEGKHIHKLKMNDTHVWTSSTGSLLTITESHAIYNGKREELHNIIYDLSECGGWKDGADPISKLKLGHSIKYVQTNHEFWHPLDTIFDTK